MTVSAGEPTLLCLLCQVTEENLPDTSTEIPQLNLFIGLPISPSLLNFKRCATRKDKMLNI